MKDKFTCQVLILTLIVTAFSTKTLFLSQFMELTIDSRLRRLYTLSSLAFSVSANYHLHGAGFPRLEGSFILLVEQMVAVSFNLAKLTW